MEKCDDCRGEHSPHEFHQCRNCGENLVLRQSVPSATQHLYLEDCIRALKKLHDELVSEALK